jgi:hypothetical protein
MKYAQRTEVPVEKSRAEIEKILMRWGATRFAYGIDETRAMIAFQFQAKQIRFTLPLPDRSDKSFRYSHNGSRRRSDPDAFLAWSQACRQRWRALALSIKSKLESVESGIESFDVAFMAHIVLPDGKTVADHVLPALEANQLPQLTF